MKKLWTLPTAMAALGLAVACSGPPSTGQSGSSAPEPSGAAKGAAAPSAATIEQGRALYKKHCAACHGEGGKGDGPAAGVLKPPPRDHTDRAYMGALTDEDIAKVIKMGGAMKGKPLMPSHPQFKEADLQALVAFIRSLSATAP